MEALEGQIRKVYDARAKVAFLTEEKRKVLEDWEQTHKSLLAELEIAKKYCLE